MNSAIPRLFISLVTFLSLVGLVISISAIPLLAQTFTIQLEPGDRGAEVGRLQAELDRQGYYEYSEYTGFYGPITTTGVQKFQTYCGIVSSGDWRSTGYGRVGLLTLQALNSGCNKLVQESSSDDASVILLRDIAIGDMGEDVASLQRFLEVSVSGIYDSVTVDAVRAFQSLHKLPETGRGDFYTRVRIAISSFTKKTANSVKESGEVEIVRKISGGSSVSAGSTPLAQPTNLSISSGDATLSLSWDDPSITDLSLVEVYRGTSADALTLLGAVSAGVEEYIDTPVDNGLTFYYALVAIDGKDDASDRTPSVSGAATGEFDIYVDSIGGNDGNSGRSQHTAFQSLAATESAALLIGNGVKIGLKRDSFWREMLNLASVTHVTLSSYGSSGKLPIITGSEIVSSGWQSSTDRGDAHSNVYSLSDWPHSGLTDEISVLEDMNRLTDVHSTLTVVNNTPGTYFTLPHNPTRLGIVYIHPSDSTNPNSNGKSYEVATRDKSVDLGDYAIVDGIETRLNSRNNGSFEIDRYGSVRRLLASFGTKHNAYARGDSDFSDTIFIESYRGNSAGGSTLMVDYDLSLQGRHATYTRVGFVWHKDKFLNNEVTAYTNHADDLTKLQSLTYDQSWAINVSGMTSGAGELRVLNSYANIRGKLPTGPNVIISRYMHNSDFGTMSGVSNLNSTKTYIDNTVLRNTALAQTNEFVTVNSGSSIFEMRNSVWITELSRNFIYERGADNSSITLRNNIFVATGGQAYWNTFLRMVPQQTYIGDYNIFYIPGDSQLNMYYGGSSVTNLSDWQVTTGQDVNSVYLTDVQAANFWLGNPSDGDFRFNPLAEVTSATGDVYIGTFPDGTPISNAGPQEHWNWNNREVADGAPSSWPNVPDTLEEAQSYVIDPEAWIF